MKKLKSILVVFNGSESGNGTIKQALKLARDGNCEVSVAIVLPSYRGKPVLVGVKNIKETLRGSVRQSQTSVVSLAEEDGAQIQTILEGENIPEAIVHAAEARGCDLIIIGRRGHKRRERSFMESVTARVIGYSPIDVLVVPRDSVIRWENMLLATDGSKCSEVATKKALEVTHNFRGKLKIVSVVNVPEEAYGEAPNAMEKLVHRAKDIVGSVKDRAKTLNIEAESFVKEGEPHEKILKIASDSAVDIICMGTYGRTGLRRFLMGSVTEKVIRKATCPVMVVKAC